MTKRRTLACGLLAILVVIYILAYFFELKRVAIVQTRSNTAHVAELDRQIERLSFIPRLLSDDATILRTIEDTSSVNIDLTNRRLQTAQQESGLDFAFLMDTDGITIASSNWDNEVSFVGKNYSFRPYFKEAIAGGTSTYFAVGATTGIPGYFIAEPILIDSTVKGVVVAKMALSAPVDTWKAQDFETVVLDEYGVVILASKDELLYQPTRPLSTSEINEIQDERRYPISQLTTSESPTPFFRFRSYSSKLLSEPWRYMTLVPVFSYHVMAAYIAIITFAFACIALLLYRTYNQQRRLVTTEKRHSRELEAQVKQRTEQLEKAQEALIAESNYAMLGRMSAAINHEINQPLASLRLNLASLRKLIEQPIGNVDEIENIVVESDRTTKRIGLVIATLRSYTRRNAIQMQKVNVSTIIKEVENTIKTERPAMSRALSIELCSDAGSVEGDSVLLQQALLNLLYNAIDSVLQSTNPVLVLSVTQPVSAADICALVGETRNKSGLEINFDQTFVNITVEDNGGGVAVEMQPDLFEPFSTSKDRKHGLGLGLTIAKQIAESHQGYLIYTRTKRGSKFSLLLPVIASVRQH